MFNLAYRVILMGAGAVQRRLSVVLFHRVLNRLDPLLAHEPDVARFDAQVRWLRDTFTLLPLGAALEHLYAGTLPAGALSITFDDGYHDNAEQALPVLQALGVPATFFITTRYLDGGMMWNDRVTAALRHWPEPMIDLTAHGLGLVELGTDRAAALHALLPCVKYLPYGEREALADELFERSAAPAARMMMDATAIRSLCEAGMEIGGHTVSHPILCKLSAHAAEREIADNKRTLENIAGHQLTLFAYPNGRPRHDYDSQHLDILRACGYRYALTTSAGTASAACDPLQIPRFTPWDRGREKYLIRMLANYFRSPDTVPAAA
jgi:peptidoglycan/xylan/chitin deacetylase (PgdA/CDA1 family)